MNRPRTQDAPQDHVENGAIYIFKPQTIRKYGQRLGGKIVAYKMSPLHSFDVDDYDDVAIEGLRVAKYKIRYDIMKIGLTEGRNMDRAQLKKMVENYKLADDILKIIRDSNK